MRVVRGWFKKRFEKKQATVSQDELRAKFEELVKSFSGTMTFPTLTQIVPININDLPEEVRAGLRDFMQHVENKHEKLH